MRQEYLLDASPLEVDYTGSQLDFYTLGILHGNLQDIIDKVTFWLMIREKLIEPAFEFTDARPSPPPSIYRRFVRAYVDEFDIEAPFDGLVFRLSSVLSDRTEREKLANIAPLVVWAIGASNIRGLRKKPDRELFSETLPETIDHDPFNVAPNLRDVLLTMKERTDEKNLVISFKSEIRSPGTALAVISDVRFDGSKTH